MPVTGPGSPLVLPNLENGKEYRARVRARNAAGWGPFSALSDVFVPEAGGFDPLDLSPHVLLDPDTFGLGDGDPIGTAPNDGSLADFTQGTAAAKPTLRANDLNGHATVENDGVDDYLAGPSLASVANGTLFLVVKMDADPPATDGKTGLWLMGSSAQGSCHCTYTDGNWYEDGGSGFTRYNLGNPSPSFTSWRIIEIRSATNDWEARLDGTVQGTPSSSNTPNFHFAPMLGKSIGSYYHDGKWAYFALFPALSSGDATSMRSWLQTRFAL